MDANGDPESVADEADAVLLVRFVVVSAEHVSYEVLDTLRGTVPANVVNEITYPDFFRRPEPGRTYLILLTRSGLPSPAAYLGSDSYYPCGVVNLLPVDHGAVERWNYDRKNGRRSIEKIRADFKGQSAKNSQRPG